MGMLGALALPISAVFRASALPTAARLPALAATPALRMMCGTPLRRSVVDQCRDKIATALSTDEVEVKGAYDDPNGSHIFIKCVSEAFEGKRSLQRQQLVFKAIWDEMQGP